MNPWWGTAFVLGLAGSAHCIGMCGPIALAVPSPSGGRLGRWAGTLLLNGGRLTTYMLLGTAVGSMGAGLRWIASANAVSVAGGVLLLASVWIPDLFQRWSPNGALALQLGRLRGRLARNLRRTAPEAIFLSGMLNGMLPCGLLYAALIGAAASEGLASSALFMALFGLGTWPALFALRMGSAWATGSLRAKLRRLSPLLISAMAVLLILRGLQLGIPFVSPAPLMGAAQGCH